MKIVDMETLDFIEKIKLMPVAYQKEVQDFVDFVWSAKLGHALEKRPRVELMGKFYGKIKMLQGFDDQIEGMEQYY
jgi:hypothetical protein